MDPGSPPRYPVIPWPAKLVPAPGEFEFTAGTCIVAGSAAEREIAGFLRATLATATGFDLEVVEPAAATGGDEVVLELGGSPGEVGAEGYSLRVTESRVEVRALEPAGLFHGVQSLRQLLPPEVESAERVEGVRWTAPCAEVEDAPRFQWRGFMLDEARHFQGAGVVGRLLDLMALLKLNVFHWHLTNDQGWRLEIKKYPRLTEVGAERKATQVGGFLSKKQVNRPHTGFYTQDEARGLVDRAKERFIEVVPETSMPGHCMAALAAYPELSCTGGPFEVATRFGIKKDVYCVGKERVFEFLGDVLDEIMDIFPSEVIHVGGDEVPRTRWRDCPECQARIREEGLENEDDLQVYFTNRIAAYLESKGRRAMGWNEILDDGLTSGAVAQYWVRGKKKVLAHLRRGRDFVMSHFWHAYLDYNYVMTPLRKAYAYEPVPKKLEPRYHDHVLGVEAPLWTEWVPSPERLGWQVFPRLAAIAEVGWTPRDGKNYESFKARLVPFLRRLDLMGVNHARLDQVDPGKWQRLLHIRSVYGDYSDNK
ncbi:MAG: beta-N-acetylhexosaminidase [Promethearchaeota archaeon]